MKLRKACKIGLLSLALSPLPAKAQDYVASEASGSVVLPSSAPIGVPGGYMWARGDFGERPGVKGDWGTVGGFAPIPTSDHSLFFLDGELWIDQQSQIGGDMGFGYRTMIGNWSSIGVNNFFTYDNSLLGNNYRRYSVGGDFYTNWFGVTANAYVPLNDGNNPLGAPIPVSGAFFQDRNLFLNTLQLVEQQLEGGDVEIGSPVPYVNWLSLYAGAYTFQSDGGTDFSGVSGRAMIDLTSVVVNFTVQNDDQFDTTFNLGVEMRLGNGPFGLVPRRRDLVTKMFDRPDKRSRILVGQGQRAGQEVAINPDTGLPYEFIHVDNTAGPGGNGSDENRYNNLGLASNSTADIILVHRGTSSLASPLPAGQGLTLTDGQLVLGEGVPFQLDVANVADPISLPDWDQSGPSPFVRPNAGFDAITLANNNEIYGLNIIAPAGSNMIAGTGIRNFTIRSVNTDFAAGQSTGAGGGIVLSNVAGTGIIEDFNYRASNVDMAAGGVVIENMDTRPLTLSLSGSDFIEGGQYGVRLVANGSSITADIDDVHATGNGSGLWLQSNRDGSVLATVDNSSFENAVRVPGTSGNNVVVRARSGGDVSLAATEVIADGADEDNLHISLDSGTAAINMTDGSLIDAGDDAVDASLVNTSQLAMVLNNTDGTNAADQGLALFADGTSDGTIGVLGSDFTGAGGNGINAVADNGSRLVVITQDTSFEGAGGQGVFGDASAGSELIFDFTNGSFSNAGSDGVVVQLNDSVGTLSLVNTNAENAGGDGLRFLAENDSQLDIDLSDVSFDNAADNAIDGTVTGAGSAVTLDANGVSGEMAGSDALHFETSAGALAANFVDPGSFANAGGNGLFVRNVQNGATSITFSGGSANFTAAGDSGLESITGSGAQTQLQFLAGANFNGAQGNTAGTGDAIHLAASGGSFNSLEGTGVSGANAARDAIRLSGNGGQIALTLQDSGPFTNAAGDGLRFTGTNGSQFDIAITNSAGITNFNSAGGRGIFGSLTDSVGTLLVQNATFENAGAEGARLVTDGSALDTTFTNVSLDNAGADGLALIGVNNSTRSFTGDAVSADNAAGDAIHVETDASTMVANLTNSTSFENSGGDGIDFSATNGAILTMAVDGPASFDDTVSTGFGVRGTVNASAATLNLQDLSFDNAAQDGIFVLTDNGTFDGTINDVTFDNAGGHAINFQAINNAIVTVNGSAIMGENAGNDAIHLETDDSLMNITLASLGSFDNFGGDGIDFNATNGAQLNLSLSGPASFDNASGYGVRARATDSNVTMNIQDATFDNAAIEGISIVTDNSTLTGSLSNISLDNAGTGSPLCVTALNGSLVTINGNNISGENAADDALHFEAFASTLAVTLDNLGSFAGFTGDGIDFVAMDGSDFTLGISGPVNFDNASGYGIIGDTVNSTATLDLANATFDNAAQNGILLTADSSTVDATLSNVSFDDAQGGDGIRLLAENGSTMTFSGDQVSGENSAGDGAHLEADNSQIAFNLTNPGSFAGFADDGIDFTSANGSNVSVSVTGPLDLSNSPDYGVIGQVTDSQGFLNLEDVNLDNATQEAIRVDVTNGTSGITLTDVSMDQAGANAMLVTSMAGSDVSIFGNNVSGSGATADGINLAANDSSLQLTLNGVTDFTNSGGDAVEFSALNGSTFSLTTSGSADFSDTAATGNGLLGTVTDSTATLDLSNASFDNAAADGFHVDVTNSGLTAEFNSVSFDSAGDDAFSLIATTGSDVTVSGTGVSGAGAGTDGLHIESTDSVMNFGLTQLGSFAGAGDNAVDVEVNNGSYPDFQFVLSGTGASQGDLSGAGSDGVKLIFNNYDGYNATAPRTFRLNNLNVASAGSDGLHIESNGTAADPASFYGTVRNTNFANAQDDAFDAFLNENPQSYLLIEDSNLSGPLDNSIAIDANNNTTFDVDVISSQATGGTSVSQDGTSTVNLNVVP